MTEVEQDEQRLALRRGNAAVAEDPVLKTVDGPIVALGKRAMASAAA